MQPQRGSKISNTEWGLIIAFSVMLDLGQFGLDWIGVGLVINPGIDVCFGAFFPWYFRRRGVKTDGKKIFAWIAGPAIDFFTDNLLPVGWMVDNITTFVLDKADQKIQNFVGGGSVVDINSRRGARGSAQASQVDNLDMAA